MNDRAYPAKEAKARRAALLRGPALDLVARQAIAIQKSHAVTVVRVDLYAYQGQAKGPLDDRVDQQWVLTLSSNAETTAQTYSVWNWYLKGWDPPCEAVSLFAAFCDPLALPVRDDPRTLGHVATFGRSGDSWAVEEHNPVSTGLDGRMSFQAQELMRYEQTRELTPADGVIREFDPEATEQMRHELLHNVMAPHVERTFELHSDLRSAIALVAQFWNDDAIDAIHVEWRFSVHETPSLEPAVWWGEYGSYTGIDDPDLPPGIEQIELELVEPFWRTFRPDLALPAIAGFCPEGGDQNRFDSFAPFALFRRTASSTQIEFIGTMLRPWLDGVARGKSNDRHYPDIPCGYKAIVAPDAQRG